MEEKLKILVVDDESRMRKLVRDFLVRSGYEVLEAGDGEAALDIFYQTKDIALLILDVMMPKMDGWEVCREIRQSSKVPIIMLTAKGKNVGNMPAELCNAIAPLHDNGNLHFLGASVSYVEPISKRSRHAKQAVLFVELKMNIRI